MQLWRLCGTPRGSDVLGLLLDVTVWRTAKKTVLSQPITQIFACSDAPTSHDLSQRLPSCRQRHTWFCVPAMELYGLINEMGSFPQPIQHWS